MRKWLILLSALSGTSVSAAPAWTWVDADGHGPLLRHASAGREQIELAGAQSVRLGRPYAARSAANKPAARRRGEVDGRAVAYRTQDREPGEQETLWNIGTDLPVQSALRSARCNRGIARPAVRRPAPQPEHGEARVSLLGRLSRRRTRCRSWSSIRRGTEVCARLRDVFFVQQTSTAQSRTAAATSRLRSESWACSRRSRRATARRSRIAEGCRPALLVARRTLLSPI